MYGFDCISTSIHILNPSRLHNNLLNEGNNNSNGNHNIFFYSILRTVQIDRKLNRNALKPEKATNEWIKWKQERITNGMNKLKIAH